MHGITRWCSLSHKTLETLAFLAYNSLRAEFIVHQKFTSLQFLANKQLLEESLAIAQRENFLCAIVISCKANFLILLKASPS
jgi:hypothetical protein